MSRKLVIDDSETGVTTIEYGTLSLPEIERKIKTYENKHGMAYAAFHRRNNEDNASPEDTDDLWDWEGLVEERKERTKGPRTGGRKREPE